MQDTKVSRSSNHLPLIFPRFEWLMIHPLPIAVSTSLDLFMRYVGKRIEVRTWRKQLLKSIICCYLHVHQQGAVHLVLTNGVSFLAFLLAFRRFASRRGLPATILSDNAKTFRAQKGTYGELFVRQKYNDF